MKISFEDKSYLEFSKSNNPGKIFITLAAFDPLNSKKLISNSVEISLDQLIAMIKSVES